MGLDGDTPSDAPRNAIPGLEKGTMGSESGFDVLLDRQY